MQVPRFLFQWPHCSDLSQSDQGFDTDTPGISQLRGVRQAREKSTCPIKHLLCHPWSLQPHAPHPGGSGSEFSPSPAQNQLQGLDFSAERVPEGSRLWGAPTWAQLLKAAWRSVIAPSLGHVTATSCPRPTPSVSFPSQTLSCPHPCCCHCALWGWGWVPACVMAPSSFTPQNWLPKEKVSH